MERFWSKTKIADNGCLVWTASKISNGYGSFGYAHETVYAHRMAWKLYYGFWPVGFILHKCDNPACVAKDHLFEGTQADNMQDGAFKNRVGGKHKLTWHQRNLIRLAWQDGNLTKTAIADIFKTSCSTVSECIKFQHEPRVTR